MKALFGKLEESVALEQSCSFTASHQCDGASLALQNKVTVRPEEQVKLLTQTSGLKSSFWVPVFTGLISLSARATTSLSRGGEEIA